MFRRVVYQYYTNVNYLTCEQCLALHGLIRRKPEAFPRIDHDCASSILPILRKELRQSREKSRRMRLRAQGELARRSLFERALSILPIEPDESLELLARAASIDLYIPDIERLVQTHDGFLRSHPDLRDRLRRQWLKAYSDKFGWRRYELLPEVMRLQREKAGLARIQELLG
ncbi:hypothetical protein KKG90_04800 [Candidatus Bipolaricaulota bacterium]|nr:hypothetical protein [Candidatus Bipolaricaulota bacterium]